MPIYSVWKEGTELPGVAEIKPVRAKHIIIKPLEPEKDGYVFLHGVAITKFRGRFYCAWAHNKVEENSADEEVNYAFSDDEGETWSPCVRGNLSPAEGVAVSHGVFLTHGDNLYFFAPQFAGFRGADMLKMSAYVWDEPQQRFRYLGVAAEERFWPMCEPVLMQNGNYILPGIYVGASYTAPENAAAVAISRGADVLHWNVVKIPKAEGVKVWGECCVTVDGSHCSLYCREHSGKRKALYAESADFGQTWSEMDLSDLPMIDSKPYAGTLSTGQRYLICSCARDVHSRSPLTIALAAKGEPFSKIYSIDCGRILSYPYAVEVDQKLYVAYSASANSGNNANNAELAVIDVRDLQ